MRSSPAFPESDIPCFICVLSACPGFHRVHSITHSTDLAGHPKPEFLQIERHTVGPWLSLVERLVRDEEAAGSNPAGPTIFYQGSRAKAYRGGLKYLQLLP
jgi:hypothetical protein